MTSGDVSAPLVVAYRWLAWTTGVLLLILVAVGMPLKYIWGHDQISAAVGMIHGIGFYPAYVIVTFALGYKYRWTALKIVLVALAGVIPLMSFVAERRVRADLPRDREAVAAGPSRRA